MITIRGATNEDIQTLQNWDKKPHVIAATGENDFIDWSREINEKAPWKCNLIAELKGRPIGIMQIIDPDLEVTHYWGEIEPNLKAIDIWIGEEADLCKGYGSKMMALAHNYCFNSPEVKAIVIDPLASNERAIRFYERLGYNKTERRMFGEDDCWVMRLERSDWLTLRKSLGKS